MQKFVSPEGEEFEVEDEATTRILNEGLPIILGDVREKRLSIKEGEFFLCTDLEGNITDQNTSGLGFYYRDTRFLSCYEFSINGCSPILLSSNTDRDYLEHIELTNSDIWSDGTLVVPQETLNIRRLRVIKDGLHEKIRIKNYNPFPVKLHLEFSFNADFADIFEVRGLKRTNRGKILRPKVCDSNLILAYYGEDEVFRQTRVTMSEKPTEVKVKAGKAQLVYEVEMVSHERILLNLYVEPVVGTKRLKRIDFDSAIGILRRSYDEWEKRCTHFFTDNELFNTIIQRSRCDLRELLTETKQGVIIYAGIPWFAAPFGRDSEITSLQTLILSPYLARETLKLLSRLQGREINPWQDEEPGKILHEIRQGELANLGVIPHTPYFGSVDSTPLFLNLAGAYFNWTNDLALMKELKDSLEQALQWIDDRSSLDSDGFITYERKSERGLINQGWKDSHYAVVHKNGEVAKAPIALIEVQGYAYSARRRMAKLLRALGEPEKAKTLEAKAEKLKKKFNAEFWIDEENFFALALDRDKRPVETVTSNAGQALWSGIVDDQKAALVVDRLLQPDMFSGWGIRTVSKSSRNYNPMSYHNGSVWPHDNALIIMGLKKYGFVEQANIIASAIFDAAIHHSYFRLPELFCGFTRRGNNYPVAYPMACCPQAWAAGSIFMILQAILGIFPDAPNDTLYIKRPTLPVWLNRVNLKGLKIGKSKLDIAFNRENQMTSFTVLNKEGDLKIVIEE